MTKQNLSAPRCVALVGPYLSGKTTLLEALLFTAGTVSRKGSAKEGNTVGDSSPEARARQMGCEVNVAAAEYLGEQWTFLDCPGSIELFQETINALMVADAAVVVCEPEVAKALTVAPLLKFLDDRKIPHVVFVNKMDNASVGVKATLEALQGVSERPLVLREIPIREGDKVVGLVDLVSERAYRWTPGKPSELIKLPEAVAEREHAARTEMLEALADFDDKLLEELLEDLPPPAVEVYQNLTKDLQQDLIVPVLFGSAEQGHGVRRLLKMLRHEAPEPAQTASRIGLDEVKGAAAVQVFKTLHAAHTGKLSLARVFRGEVADGATLDGARVGGVARLLGAKQTKLAKAVLGEVVGLGRMDEIKTGQTLTDAGTVHSPSWPEALKPLFSLAIHAEKREDEVKLTAGLAKLADEDPSLAWEVSPDTGELLIWGQGEMHLLIAIDRLRNRFGLAVKGHRPQVAYKETIRKGVSQHARHKKQSGGHGEFGDVHLTIQPRPRGGGFEFKEKVTGGAVPRQFFPGVESGVRDGLKRGPLGFPVIDLEVMLTDGQFHTVDSSEMAFRKAAFQAMREGLPKCEPVLLEPIYQVSISLPTEFTSKIQRLISGRRGSILGYDAKPGWKGWDEVVVQLPQAEMHDLIVELRSLTLGVGSFQWKFDHLQELVGKVADHVVARRASELQQT